MISTNTDRQTDRYTQQAHLRFECMNWIKVVDVDVVTITSKKNTNLKKKKNRNSAQFKRKTVLYTKMTWKCCFTKLTNTISLNNSWIIIFYSRCLLNIFSFLFLYYFFQLYTKCFIKIPFLSPIASLVWLRSSTNSNSDVCNQSRVNSFFVFVCDTYYHKSETKRSTKTSFSSVPVNSFAIGLLFPLLNSCIWRNNKKVCT